MSFDEVPEHSAFSFGYGFFVMVAARQSRRGWMRLPCVCRSPLFTTCDGEFERVRFNWFHPRPLNTLKRRLSRCRLTSLSSRAATHDEGQEEKELKSKINSTCRFELNVVINQSRSQLEGEEQLQKRVKSHGCNQCSFSVFFSFSFFKIDSKEWKKNYCLLLDAISTFR